MRENVDFILAEKWVKKSKNLKILKGYFKGFPVAEVRASCPQVWCETLWSSLHSSQTLLLWRWGQFNYFVLTSFAMILFKGG